MTDYPFTRQCFHLVPHQILIRDSVDHMALALFEKDGWTDAGYCLAYMPNWLRPKYDRHGHEWSEGCCFAPATPTPTEDGKR